MFGIKDKLSSLFGSSSQKKQPKETDKDVVNRMKSGHFTLDDFAKQMSMFDKIGSISKVMRYMPGGKGLNITPTQIEQGKQELKRLKSIIKVMRVEERQNPALLTKARKEEIARGSGLSVTDIENMLKRFEESKQFVKLYMKKGQF